MRRCSSECESSVKRSAVAQASTAARTASSAAAGGTSAPVGGGMWRATAAGSNLRDSKTRRAAASCGEPTTRGRPRTVPRSGDRRTSGCPKKIHRHGRMRPPCSEHCPKAHLRPRAWPSGRNLPLPRGPQPPTASATPALAARQPRAGCAASSGGNTQQVIRRSDDVKDWAGDLHMSRHTQGWGRKRAATFRPRFQLRTVFPDSTPTRPHATSVLRTLPKSASPPSSLAFWPEPSTATRATAADGFCDACTRSTTATRGMRRKLRWQHPTSDSTIRRCERLGRRSPYVQTYAGLGPQKGGHFPASFSAPNGVPRQCGAVG